MTRALDAAQKAAAESSRSLIDLTGRAELSAQRLELLLASLHDLPDPDSALVRRTRVIHRRLRDRSPEAA